MRSTIRKVNQIESQVDFADGTRRTELPPCLFRTRNRSERKCDAWDNLALYGAEGSGAVIADTSEWARKEVVYNTYQSFTIPAGLLYNGNYRLLRTIGHILHLISSE